MNAVVDKSVQRRSRMQLILIAMLFAAPVVTAWVAWNFAVSDGVQATTNAGQLVSPARPLQPVELVGVSGDSFGDKLLLGHWSYVLLSRDGCDQQCAEKLYLTRQVRTSVNKDMQRVQRLLVVRKLPKDLDEISAAHPDLKVAVADETAWRAFSGQFGSEVSAEQGVFFMIDPLGNLMMRYDDSVEPKGVLKDLRKLLKVSQVG